MQQLLGAFCFFISFLILFVGVGGGWEGNFLCLLSNSVSSAHGSFLQILATSSTSQSLAGFHPVHSEAFMDNVMISTILAFILN